MTRIGTLTALALLVLLASCARTPPDTLPVTVSVDPATAELEPGESMEFTATVTGATSTAVNWSTTCGSVTGSGSTVTYTAPGSVADCLLTATSVASPQASDAASIAVREAAADAEVTSNTDPETPVTVLEMGDGETWWIRVNVPSGQRGNERRLVVEADDDGGAVLLDMALFDEDRTTARASTSGTAYFRPGLEGIGEGFIGTGVVAADGARPLRDAPTDVDRSVSIVAECFGPCISRAIPAGVTHVWVRLTHLGFGDEAVPFYAYTEPFIDEEEPSNDSAANAVQVTPGSPYRGALEVLDDVDWVSFDTNGLAVVTQRDGYDLDVMVELFDASDVFVDTYGPGETFEVLAGDRAAIFSNPDAPRASVYGWYDVAYDTF